MIQIECHIQIYKFCKKNEFLNDYLQCYIKKYEIKNMYLNIFDMMLNIIFLQKQKNKLST